MKIANGIEMLEITATVMGNTNTIYPTLLWDEQNTILVDTGYPGQLPIIIEAMENAGVSFRKLNKIILTHQDLDHIGSLPDIIHESPQKVEVLAHELEKPFIQGDKRLLKLPKDTSHIPEGLRAVFEHPPAAQVDGIIKDGDELPYAGGLIVIDTPGHTPGHISLYHKPSRTLIAGDALVAKDHQLYGPAREHTLDMDTAIQSLKTFTHYDIENVICYHGGLCGTNMNKRIKELA